MPTGADSEFGFELRVCAWAERAWPPGGDTERQVLVARQLGWGRRRWDTLVIEVDPVALAERSVFGTDHLNGDLLHVVRNAPESWAYYRDALPHPGYPWRYVREAIHEAAARDAIESRKNGRRIEIRRVAPYPGWVNRIVAIENKPDLDASAARALQGQLERDVAIGLADEVWLATEATGEPVEPALLERVPVEVGILALDDSGVDVLWQPRTLETDQPGTRIVDRPGKGGYDNSAAKFEYMSGEEKATKRLEIAERAYERGWRSYIEAMRPDCRQFGITREGDAYLPTCRAKGREQTANECRQTCPSFEPEPPAWRQMQWPLEGGPGNAVRRVLENRRDRHRQAVSAESNSTDDRGTANR